MKGLVLCRSFFMKYGMPMITEQFPDIADQICCGLVGYGSECLGYDDELSADHDFGPGFCIWVTEDVFKSHGKKLQEAYDALPQEYEGYSRKRSREGERRVGVLVIEDFFNRVLGFNSLKFYQKGGITHLRAPMIKTVEWPIIDEAALATATNGQIFYDPSGMFSTIYEELKAYYPDWFWYLRIATEAALFSQQAQYNYNRLIKRGDLVSCQMALTDGIKSAMKLICLLNREYAPFGKWLYARCRDYAKREELRVEQGEEEENGSCPSWKYLPSIMKRIERLIITPNPLTMTTLYPSEQNSRLADILGDIEWIGHALAFRMHQLGIITEEDKRYLQSISDKTQKFMADSSIQTDTMSAYLDDYVPVLRAKAKEDRTSSKTLVEEIIREEFEAFDQVTNVGGRATCQDDWKTFSIMRRAQYMVWTQEMLLQYLDDFRDYRENGINPITQKYGFMMETNDPAGFEKIKDGLLAVSPQKKSVIEAIVGIQTGFMEQVAVQYPELTRRMRNLRTGTDTPQDTSYETYLRGELSTYTDKMIKLYGAFIAAKARAGENLSAQIMTETVKLYGLNSLEEAEEFLKK